MSADANWGSLWHPRVCQTLMHARWPQVSAVCRIHCLSLKVVLETVAGCPQFSSVSSINSHLACSSPSIPASCDSEYSTARNQEDAGSFFIHGSFLLVQSSSVGQACWRMEKMHRLKVEQTMRRKTALLMAVEALSLQHSEDLISQLFYVAYEVIRWCTSNETMWLPACNLVLASEVGESQAQWIHLVQGRSSPIFLLLLPHKAGR